MKKAFAAAVLTLIFTHLYTSAATAHGTDFGSFLTDSIYAETLDEDRPLSIWLPLDYENSGECYPVLYLLDGRHHIFHVAGMVDYLVLAGRVPEVILVGVHRTNRMCSTCPGNWANDDSPWRPDEAAKLHSTAMVALGAGSPRVVAYQAGIPS